MPLGISRQSLNLANPVADSIGTYQGYFRSSSATVLNAYNTAGTSQGSVTHGCGTVSFIRARRIPGTTSHIVGVSGATAAKFYRYTAGTFTQLATFAANSRHCDITFDTTNNKIYMVANRSTTPFIQLYEATLSDSITTATLLSNPVELPQSADAVRFSPSGLLLAVKDGGNSGVFYTRSGSTFSNVAMPANIGFSSGGNGHFGLSFNALSNAIAFPSSETDVRAAFWNGTAFANNVNAVISSAQLASVSFNPNPSYANIMLVSDDTNESGAAFYYSFPTAISTTGFNANSQYQMENAQWSPDGLKVFLQHTSSTGRIFDLNTSYGTGTPIATLLGAGTAQAIGARGFDWMYH